MIALMAANVNSFLPEQPGPNRAEVEVAHLRDASLPESARVMSVAAQDLFTRQEDIAGLGFRFLQAGCVLQVAVLTQNQRATDVLGKHAEFDDGSGGAQAPPGNSAGGLLSR